MFHVMAGDKFDLSAETYWDPVDGPAPPYSIGSNMMSSLLGTLGSGISSAAGGEVANTTIVGNAGTSLSGSSDAFQSLMDQATTEGVPRAYLNYLVFDENMNLLADQSGAIQVGATPSQWNTITTGSPVEAKTNGYVIFYLNNAQYQDVYFDNFSVIAYKGKLLQSQHYYPYGLTVDEGHDPATEPNKNLLEGNKMQDELGLLTYDFNFRQYDPQIGRFSSVDKLAEDQQESFSPYHFCGNDPANAVDPLGLGDKWMLNLGGVSIIGQKPNQPNNTNTSGQAALAALTAGGGGGGTVGAAAGSAGGGAGSADHGGDPYNKNYVIISGNGTDTKTFMQKIDDAIDGGQGLENLFGTQSPIGQEFSSIDNQLHVSDDEFYKWDGPDGYKNYGLPALTLTYNILGIVVSAGAFSVEATLWNAASLELSVGNTITGGDRYTNATSVIMDVKDAAQGNPVSIMNLVKLGAEQASKHFK